MLLGRAFVISSPASLKFMEAGRNLWRIGSSIWNENKNHLPQRDRKNDLLSINNSWPALFGALGIVPDKNKKSVIKNIPLRRFWLKKKATLNKTMIAKRYAMALRDGSLNGNRNGWCTQPPAPVFGALLRGSRVYPVSKPIPSGRPEIV